MVWFGWIIQCSVGLMTEVTENCRTDGHFSFMHTQRTLKEKRTLGWVACVQNLLWFFGITRWHFFFFFFFFFFLSLLLLFSCLGLLLFVCLFVFLALNSIFWRHVPMACVFYFINVDSYEAVPTNEVYLYFNVRCVDPIRWRHSTTFLHDTSFSLPGHLFVFRPSGCADPALTS